MTPAIKSVLMNSLCRAAALLYVSALIAVVWFIVHEIKLLRKKTAALTSGQKELMDATPYWRTMNIITTSNKYFKGW